MNLSTNESRKKHNYSPLERKVFEVLKEQPKSTVDITHEIYGRNRPTYARQSVLVALNGLADKVKLNREPFRVKKSKRKGPHPVNFWVEK